MVSEQTATTPDAPDFRTIGYVDYPNSVKFEGKLVEMPEITTENLDKMLKFDGQVGGLFRILITPIKAATIEVEKPNNRANRETNFIKEILLNSYSAGGMITTMPLVMSTIMRMLINGWSPHEIVWEVKNGAIRVKKIDYRPTTSTVVMLDSNNDFDGYEQDLGKLEVQRRRLDVSKVRIPGQKSMHFVNGYEWNPVYGRSLFTQAYYHFEKKHKLYYISHLAAQINALRLRVLKSPEDDPIKINKYVDLVSKLGFNSTINLPTNWDLDLLDTGNNFPDILPLIQHHDAQMSKSVLAQVLDVGVEGRTGSFNLSDTHFDIFIVNLELMANYISDVFNSVLVPKLIDWNFGTGLYPKVKFLPFDRQIKAQLFEIFKALVSTKKANAATPEFQLEIEHKIADIVGLDLRYEEMEGAIDIFKNVVRDTPEGQDPETETATTTSSEN